MFESTWSNPIPSFFDLTISQQQVQLFMEDIPVKILKNSIHIYSEKLTNIFYECLINGKFPDTLKRADVTSIFKKRNDNEKENYRPVSMCLKSYYLNKLMTIYHM